MKKEEDREKFLRKKLKTIVTMNTIKEKSERLIEEKHRQDKERKERDSRFVKRR